jgi:hypothetical protein
MAFSLSLLERAGVRASGLTLIPFSASKSPNGI